MILDVEDGDILGNGSFGILSKTVRAARSSRGFCKIASRSFPTEFLGDSIGGLNDDHERSMERPILRGALKEKLLMAHLKSAEVEKVNISQIYNDHEGR